MNFMFFDCDNGAVLARRRDQIESITLDGFIGTAEIVNDDGITLVRYRDAMINAGSVDEMRHLLLNLIGSLPSGPVSNAEIVYTAGGCDILAAALARVVPEGKIVGLFDPFQEDGAPIIGPHHLIHAGLLVGNEVIDITGSFEMEDWRLQWCHLGSLDTYTEDLTEAQLDEIRHRPISEMEKHNAREVAELLAFAIDATAPQRHVALQA
jgi:hypothetical protein